MMYRNHYVLAIKDQSKRVLREIDGKVYLPFNSEYSVLLKNRNSVDALCKVSIDGTDVLGSDELLVPAGLSVDLERFLVDGNALSGKRFKFVPVTDSQVQDPTSGSNGIVEVQFWATFSDVPSGVCRSFGKSIHPNSGASLDNVMYANQVGAHADSISFAASVDTTPAAAGATVAGSVSNQRFNYVYNKTKVGLPTVLRLQLLGRAEEPLLVNTALFCTKCGKSVKFTDNFCNRCGTPVVAGAIL